MAQPYVGEIRMFGGNFAPAGWMFCEGQLLPISENETMFQLLGTTYGGDGEETFALPDLRGRIPVHQHFNGGFPIGQAAGVEEVVLTNNQMPVHSHPLLASGVAGSTPNPSGNVLAGSPNLNLYIVDIANQPLAPTSVSPVGGSQPHTNFQPYLCVDFIISLFGLFPNPT
jgi:microcystin-dependent protein